MLPGYSHPTPVWLFSKGGLSVLAPLSNLSSTGFNSCAFSASRLLVERRTALWCNWVSCPANGYAAAGRTLESVVPVCQNLQLWFFFSFFNEATSQFQGQMPNENGETLEQCFLTTVPGHTIITWNDPISLNCFGKIIKNNLFFVKWQCFKRNIFLCQFLPENQLNRFHTD